jgi:hypothetical protein
MINIYKLPFNSKMANTGFAQSKKDHSGWSGSAKKPGNSGDIQSWKLPSVRDGQ